MYLSQGLQPLGVFWLFRDYTVLGYAVVRVPVLPPEERVQFILERAAE